MDSFIYMSQSRYLHDLLATTTYPLIIPVLAHQLKTTLAPRYLLIFNPKGSASLILLPKNPDNPPKTWSEISLISI
jgi:hypothetical protein